MKKAVHICVALVQTEQFLMLLFNIYFFKVRNWALIEQVAVLAAVDYIEFLLKFRLAVISFQ